MENIISKELLSELGYGEVTYIGDIIELYEMQCIPFKCNITRGSGRNDGKTIITSKAYHIALEVIAHKCKEWALKYNLDCNSGYDFDNKLYNCQVFSYKQGMEIKYVLADIEVKAIFKACQWIVDIKDKQMINELLKG